MPKCKENSFVSANVKKLADIGPGWTNKKDKGEIMITRKQSE